MKSKRINFKSEKGISLVEVLLSVALLAIIAGPLLGTVYMSAKNNVTAKEKTEAVALAERVMEEKKAQGAISVTNEKGEAGKDFVPYEGVTSEKLVAYYDIKKEISGKVAQAVSTGTPEEKTYKDKIEAANNADFVLEIDHRSSSTDRNVYVTLKQSDGRVLGTADTAVNTDNESILLKLITITKRCAVYIKGSVTSSLIGMPEFSNTSDVKIKVLCKNSLSGSNKHIRIFTSIPDSISFTPYVMDDDQTNQTVTFSNSDDSKVGYDVTYLDSTYFNYDNNTINDLFKITVEIRKKDTAKVVYTMTSYVKK